MKKGKKKGGVVGKKTKGKKSDIEDLPSEQDILTALSEFIQESGLDFGSILVRTRWSERERQFFVSYTVNFLLLDSLLLTFRIGNCSPSRSSPSFFYSILPRTKDVLSIVELDENPTLLCEED